MNPIGDTLFFVKTLVFTIVFIIFLQIRVGTSTLEEKFMGFVYTSEIAEPIHEIANGGVALARDAWKKVLRHFKSDVLKDFRSSNIPGSRNLGIQFERSKSYLEEKAKEAAEKLQEDMQQPPESDSNVIQKKNKSRFD